MMMWEEVMEMEWAWVRGEARAGLAEGVGGEEDKEGRFGGRGGCGDADLVAYDLLGFWGYIFFFALSLLSSLRLVVMHFGYDLEYKLDTSWMNCCSGIRKA